MAPALRSLVLLCTAGASLSLFCQEIWGAWLIPFISANTMSLASRTRLLVLMAVGAAALGLLGLLAWSRGSKRLERFAHLAAPLVLLGFVPPLFAKPAWPNVLQTALVLAGFVLLAERLYRMFFAALHPTLETWGRVGAAAIPAGVRRWSPAVLVGAGALAYAIYMSVFTLYMHGRFQTYNYDLGQYDSIFWNTLHGYPLRDAPLGLNENWHELRNHAELSVFFFLPFYALKPGGPILLVIQSAMLGLGAIPVYRFAARRLPRAYAATLAFAFLFYPPTHGLQFYDFHFQPVAATCVLFVIDFVDARRYWWCAFFFAVAIGSREDISVGLAILGTFLVLTGYRARAGLVMAAVASAYFVVMRFIIMPSFGSWGFQDVYKDLFPTGAPTFGGIIATLISNPIFTLISLLQPEKLRYVLQILVPLAFLPLRRSYLIVSIIPGSIFTILTTQYAPTIDIGFQYSGHFLPYVFCAAALAISAFGTEREGLARRRAALSAVVTGTVLCGVFWGAIPPRDSVHGGFSMLPMRAPNEIEKQKDRDLRELHKLVPPKASLAMSEAEMTHVSHLNMKGLRDTNDADYILYAVGSGYAGAHNAEKGLLSGEFEKIAERPGVALLRRKALRPPGPPVPAAAPPVPAPGLKAPPVPAPVSPVPAPTLKAPPVPLVKPGAPAQKPAARPSK